MVLKALGGQSTYCLVISLNGPAFQPGTLTNDLVFLLLLDSARLRLGYASFTVAAGGLLEMVTKSSSKNCSFGNRFLDACTAVLGTRPMSLNPAKIG
jgi:hypothetical protein